MIHKKTISVVIPAYNEEKQINNVISTIPDFVDKIVIVNDHSQDETEKVVKRYISNTSTITQELKKKSLTSKLNSKYNKYGKAEEVLSQIKSKEQNLYAPFSIINKTPEQDRIILVNHLKNAGVGAAIATGYKWCMDHQIDCTAVMAGDGQMDPDELKAICEPVVADGIDYVKGNRLTHRSAFFVIPKIRYFGNSILSLLTKIASGYWHVSDTQCGYTAISLNALRAIRIHDIYKNYGCPNDILVKLNIAFCTIKEVKIKPVYSIGEVSKMKIWKIIPPISFLLFISFFRRLFYKYLFRDFHPLFLLYNFSFILLLADIPFIYQAVQSLGPRAVLPTQSLLILIFLTISGFQSLFFAMWMDMQDNERLQK